MSETVAPPGITRVCLPFSPEHLTDVPDVFDYTVADGTVPWPPEALAAQFYVPAYMVGFRTVRVIADMPALRVVQSLTAGVDHFPPLAPGVILCNATGVHDAATAELAVGLIIASQRDLPRLLEQQRSSTWIQRPASSLADKRVVLVGAGSIGQAIRRRLLPFECDVVMVGRTARDGVHAVAELPELLPEADIVVLIVPITDETRGMVDAAFLARLPEGALLVNMARGPVVDTDALVAEVASGRLRCALDVTDPEPPPPDHPLWDLPGVIISAHTGGASTAMWPRVHRLVSAQLKAVAEGRPLANVVPR